MVYCCQPKGQLRDRLKVGQQPLKLCILVRFQVPQQKNMSFETNPNESSLEISSSNIFDREKMDISFGDKTGPRHPFEHTFFIGDEPALYISGFYDAEVDELYISKIEKNRGSGQHGLAEEAIQIVINEARDQGFEIKKITADASPALVRSLERSKFADRFTVAEQSSDSGGDQKEISINLE